MHRAHKTVIIGNCWSFGWCSLLLLVVIALVDVVLGQELSEQVSIESWSSLVRRYKRVWSLQEYTLIDQAILHALLACKAWNCRDALSLLKLNVHVRGFVGFNVGLGKSVDLFWIGWSRQEGHLLIRTLHEGCISLANRFIEWLRTHKSLRCFVVSCRRCRGLLGIASHWKLVGLYINYGVCCSKSIVSLMEGALKAWALHLYILIDCNWLHSRRCTRSVGNAILDVGLPVPSFTWSIWLV